MRASALPASEFPWLLLKPHNAGNGVDAAFGRDAVLFRHANGVVPVVALAKTAEHNVKEEISSVKIGDNGVWPKLSPATGTF